MSRTGPRIIREAVGWRRPRWISVDLEKVYFRLEAMTGDECRAHCLTVLKGCMTGEREAGGLADLYLRDCEEHYARRAKAGQKGGLAKAKNARAAKNPTVKQCPSNALAMLDTPNTIHKTNTETENPLVFPRAGARKHAQAAGDETGGGGAAGEGGGLDGASSKGEEVTVGGDGKAGSNATSTLSGALAHFRKSHNKAAMVRASSSDTVVPYMMEFCGPEDGVAYRNALSKRLGEIGVVRFKKECASFVASVENGNEPKCRAATLLARLNNARAGGRE